MKIKLFTGIMLLFTLCMDAHSQPGWVLKNGGTSLNIYDIQFLNIQTGYFLCGQRSSPPYTHTIRKTTNGGVSWFTVYVNNSALNKIFFLNSNTGFTTGSLGIIVKTIDGGNSWVPMTSPLGAALFGIKFIDDNTGFIAGQSRTFLITTDGGNSWDYRPIGPTDGLWKDIYFFDSNTGLIAGYPPAGSSINKTTDGGMNWTASPGPLAGYEHIDFADSFTGFCAGISGISKTTDRGNSWFNINNTGTYDFFGLSVINSNTVIVAGGTNPLGSGGKIFKTTNGGTNWERQDPLTTKRLWAVSFINENIGWACGDTGTLMKTTTGGVITGFEEINNGLSVNFSLQQNYPNPFNPNTVITYKLPRAGNVILNIYDAGGRLIKTFDEGSKQAGSYLINFSGVDLAAGIYYYSLFADGVLIDTKKSMLIK